MQRDTSSDFREVDDIERVLTRQKNKRKNRMREDVMVACIPMNI